MLVAMRQHAAAAADLDALLFNQALVQLYPPGATIGWHRDAEVFGPTIIGVSFGSAVRLRFRQSRAFHISASIEIPPRSVYVLAGVSRTDWQHSIPPVPRRRLSVTFRSFVSFQSEAANIGTV